MSPTTPTSDPDLQDEGAGDDPIPRLRRSTSDRRLVGVAGGIGAYFAVDPVLVRILFVLASFVGGAGILAYLAAWVLMPEDDGTVPTRARTGEWGGDGARFLAIALAVVAAAYIAFDGRWWGDGILVPIGLVAGGLWLLLRPDRLGAATDATPAAPVPPPPPPPPSVPSAAAPAAPPPPARRRGIATRLTLGIVALLAGGIGLAVAAGADISIEAALLACLAATGVGMVVGAFTGGARGLILLAVPLLLGVSVATALDVPLDWSVGERTHRPAAVAEVEDAYRLGAGVLELDLRDLDPAELDGPVDVEASVALGELLVLVPDGVDVEVSARTTAGEITVFGDLVSGTSLTVDQDRAAGDGDGSIVLDLRAGLGTVSVR